MIAILLIALTAGCASAVMFASVISGEMLALVLFYLAPLPLMVAALGWGPVCAAIGGIAAALGLGAILGFSYFFGFALAVALPAWWLGHLVLLGRPTSGVAHSNDNASIAAPPLEWYPLGRLLLWIAGLATLMTFAGLLTIGTDAATITATLHDALSRVLKSADTPLPADMDQWIDAMIRIAQGAATMFAVVTLSLNLWLAGKIAATSGRLRRPWPDLKTTTLSPMTLVALFAAIGLSFAGGLLAILATIAASALLMAYALTGFAVLHTLTLSLKGRPFVLGGIYAVVLIVWPLLGMVVLAMAALGLADVAFGLRQRFWLRRPPPLPIP